MATDKIITFAANSDLYNRLAAKADAESKKNGFRVPISAVIRKSIDTGLKTLEEE